MKVIKHGNTIKELTCPKCGCIFQAGEADAHTRRIPPGQYKPLLKLFSIFFVCPECGHECGGGERHG